MAKKETRQEQDLANARFEINEQIYIHGEYSHNVVSCILRRISAIYGKKVANQLVYDLDLDDEFGIGPVKED
jgi:hypothetical protein